MDFSSYRTKEKWRHSRLVSVKKNVSMSLNVLKKMLKQNFLADQMDLEDKNHSIAKSGNCLKGTHLK